MLEFLEIIMPDDFHVHFRQGERLKNYVYNTAQHFARALIMPNTTPAITNVDEMLMYKQEIDAAHKQLKSSLADARQSSLADARQSSLADAQKPFEPLLTFKIYSQNYDEIFLMKQQGVIAGKLYPQGVTTNAEDGIKNIKQAYPVFEALQTLDMVLCIHGEDPQSFVLDREKNFLHTLSEIRANFSKLRIVLEHVSSKEGIDYVRSAKSNYLAATITVHHLLYNLDAVLGNYLNPHMFCKPVLKSPVDMQAIQKVVLESHPSFFLGTDSAPHDITQKECCAGCAGVYSAPVALPLLTQFFYSQRHLWANNIWGSKLEQFCSKFGADYYLLPYNTQKIVIEHKKWRVPDIIDGVVPLCAGHTLDWHI